MTYDNFILQTTRYPIGLRFGFHYLFLLLDSFSLTESRMSLGHG